MSGTSGDRHQVEILEQFLRDLDECYGGDAPDVQEVKCSVRRLMERVTRRRIESVAEVARQGKALQAHQLLQHHFPDTALCTVQNVLQLVYLDSDNLKSAIEFVAKCEPDELLLGAFKALIGAVTFRKHTDKIEMLLLQKSIVDLDVPRLATETRDTALSQMILQVNADCSQIHRGIIAEFMNNDLSLAKKITTSFGTQLLDRTVSNVVGLFSTIDMKNILQLIKVSQNLPHTSNRCSLVLAIWHKSSKLEHQYSNQRTMRTMQGVHLWAHARAIQEEKHFNEVDLVTRQTLDSTVVALFRGFKEFMIIRHGNPPPLNLSKNRDMIWSAAIVAFERLQGNVHQMQMSEQVCQVDNHEVLACILCLMFRETVQKHSFEEFCIFAKARQLTEMAEGPVRSLGRLLAEIPSCVCHLLWPDSNCPGFQIANKFFQQPLSILIDSRVFVGDEQLLWGVEIEPTSCLAAFQLKTAGGSRLIAQDGEVCYSEGQRAGWKIKIVDDLHVKIYSEKGNETELSEFNFILNVCF
jgi:hypothetical protein